MFGLEEENRKVFEFDLEKTLKSSKAEKDKIQAAVQKNKTQLKNKMQKGADSDKFEDLGILLHGYVALEKVINKVTQKGTQ